MSVLMTRDPAAGRSSIGARESAAPLIVAKPVTKAEFAAALLACAPFEPRPHVALAVSGGSDSVALMLLMRDWLATRNGRGLVLTLDHGLRRAAQAETALVRTWALCLGFDCRVLSLPATGGRTQESLRRARYDALICACRQAGSLHLFLAHHENDQAETFLMRHFRGSTPIGLAAMPRVSERPDVRLVRPLLAFAKMRLKATCQSRQQAWIDDPSNRDTRYERTRWRMVMPLFSVHGFNPRHLAKLAAHAGRHRASLERRCGAFIAATTACYPQGYVCVETGTLTRVAPEISRHSMAALLCMVSGKDLAPRRKATDALVDHMTGTLRPYTLHGCHVLPVGQGGRRWLICRESALVRHKIAAKAGKHLMWDQRFLILTRSPDDMGDAVWAHLGEAGWRYVKSDIDCALPPYPVRLSLPALWEGGRLLYVPHLGWAAKEIKPGKIKPREIRPREIRPREIRHSVVASTRLYWRPLKSASGVPFSPVEDYGTDTML